MPTRAEVRLSHWLDGGVSDGGFGTDDFADEVLSDDDAVDFDPHSAWGGGDEVTAALPDGAHAATTTWSQREPRGRGEHVSM